MANVDWISIRAEYETTGLSQRKLADKHGVSFPTLRDRAKRGEWVQSKKKTHDEIIKKTLQKTVTKIATKEADRNARHIAILDKILDKVDKVISEELSSGMTAHGEVIELPLILADKLDTAMKVLEKVQKSHRLALGLDKEIKTKDNTDRAQSMKLARERARNARRSDD